MIKIMKIIFLNEHALAKSLDKILHSTSPLIACVNALHLIVRLYT